MNNKAIFAAAIGMMAAVIFASCEKMETPGQDASWGMRSEVKSRVDSLIRVYPDENSKDMRFVGNNEVECSFTEMEEWKESGIKTGEKKSVRYTLTAQGDEKADVFTNNFAYTTRLNGKSGQKVVETKSASTNPEWTITKVDTTYAWRATNTANAVFDHSHVAGAAMSVLYESADHGYKVQFEPVTVAVSEKTTFGDEYNVVIDSKNYRAVDYKSTHENVFALPKKYGGDTKTVPTQNERRLLALQSNVTQRLEDLSYQAQFSVVGNELKTDIQQNSFNIVEYDYDKVVSKTPYKRNLNLNVKASQPNDITVGSDVIGKASIVSYNKGNVNANTVQDGIFTRTTSNFEDVVVISDGTRINVNGLWESERWNETEFPYAMISDRSARIVSVERNAAMCTSSREVHTVTVDLIETVRYVNVNKADETKTIQVKYNQIYDIPDNFHTEMENQAYVGRFQSAGAELSTIEQYNAYDMVKYNNNTVVETKSYKKDLDLSAKAVSQGNVTIQKAQRGQAVSLRGLTTGANRVSDASADANGFAKRTTTQAYTVRMSDGAVIDVATAFDKEMKDKKDALNHSKITAIQFVSASTPVKNEAASGNGKEVYDVTVNLSAEVERTATNPVTKAASSDEETYPLVVKYQQIYTVEDELVSVRRVPSVENGKPTVKTYEVWSQSGEKLVATEQYDVNATLTATAGSDVYAPNVNFGTTSNGLSGAQSKNSSKENWTVTTESGNYTSTMSNGEKSEVNRFAYSYDKVIVYKNGNDTFTFNGTFPISENTAPITANGTKDGYSVYKYATTASAPYSIDGNSVVTRTAQVTRNILVKVEIPKNTPWGIIRGMTVTAVPAHSIGNGRYADGPGPQQAHKCFDLHTSTGTVTIVMPMGEEITLNKVLAGDFWSGNYDQYNSGYYLQKENKWKPCRAEDASTGIKYYVGNDCVRSIRNESLDQWSWSNKKAGSFSTVVDGYTFVLQNEVLTISHNGKVVLELK